MVLFWNPAYPLLNGWQNFMYLSAHRSEAHFCYKQQKNPKLSEISKRMKTTLCPVCSSSVISCGGWGDAVTLKTSMFPQGELQRAPTQCCWQQTQPPLQTAGTVPRSPEANCLAPCSRGTGIAIPDWCCWIKFVPSVFCRVFMNVSYREAKPLGSKSKRRNKLLIKEPKCAQSSAVWRTGGAKGSQHPAGITEEVKSLQPESQTHPFPKTRLYKAHRGESESLISACLQEEIKYVLKLNP